MEPLEWVQEREHQHLRLPQHQPSLNHCPKERCKQSWTPHKLFHEQPVMEDCHRHTTHICTSLPFSGPTLRDWHHFPLCWHEQQKDQPQPKEAVRVTVIASHTASGWRTSLIVESLFCVIDSSSWSLIFCVSCFRSSVAMDEEVWEPLKLA